MRPTAPLHLLRLLRQPLTGPFLALACCAAVGVSCAQGVGGTTGTPNGANGDNATGDDDDQGTGDDDNVNPDSGAFGQGDAGDDDDDAPGREAGPEAGLDAGDAGDAGDAAAKADTGAPDAATDGGGSTAPTCPEMTSGTLIIVEIMIASKSGNFGSDKGEYVELLNPSSTCAVQLSGFTVTSPRGASADTAVLDDGYKVGPGETVLVADSLATADNNGLTGQIYAWNDNDVLANGGDTVSVLHGTTVLNTFDYSAGITVVDGRALEYPSVCSTKNVSDLGNWQFADIGSTYGTISACGTSANAACEGTPNAPNTDVSGVTGCE